MPCQGQSQSPRSTARVSTTKPGTLLGTSITIRKAGDEVEADLGFFEADTVWPIAGQP